MNGGQSGAYNLLLGYVGPTQINAFVPMEVNPLLLDNCTMDLSTPNGNVPASVKGQFLSPALFTYGPNYAAAVLVNGVIVGTTSGTLPASSGSILSLFGTGFGPTNPGEQMPKALATDVTVLVNGQPVKLLWAGMVGVGLYQINIQLPNLDPGDYAVSVQISGIETEQAILPVR